MLQRNVFSPTQGEDTHYKHWPQSCILFVGSKGITWQILRNVFLFPSQTCAGLSRLPARCESVISQCVGWRSQAVEAELRAPSRRLSLMLLEARNTVSRGHSHTDTKPSLETPPTHTLLSNDTEEIPLYNPSAVGFIFITYTDGGLQFFIA